MEIMGNIGVITRNFDAERILAEFQSLDNIINEMEMDIKHTTVLAKRKAGVRLPVLREERDLLKNILNRKVYFRHAGKKIEFTFDVKISKERTGEEFYYHLICNHAFS